MVYYPRGSRLTTLRGFLFLWSMIMTPSLSPRSYVVELDECFFFGGCPIAATAKRYSTDHEYVIYDDHTNVGIVGITEYAQKALGDVVFVELPAQGSEVAKGGE